MADVSFTKRRLGLLLVAALLAGAATWAAHRYIARHGPPPGRPPDTWYGLLYLNSILSLRTDYMLDGFSPGPPERDLPRPADVQALLDRICERVRPFLGREEGTYDVWIGLCLRTTDRGWPFVSSSTIAHVVIDGITGENSDREYDKIWRGPDIVNYNVQYSFDVDDSGNSPVRYSGLVGNWTVYLLGVFPVVWLCDRGVCAIIRRFRHKRHGFPVVLVEEDASEG